MFDNLLFVDTQLQQQLVDKLDALETCLTKVPDSPSLSQVNLFILDKSLLTDCQK